MTVLSRRLDGSFVMLVNGMPYHVVAGDPLFQPNAAAAATAPVEQAPADPPLAARRAAATLTRAQFLLACVDAAIITEQEAEEAADGSWPSTFDDFLLGMAAAQRIEAKAVWASRSDVRRMSPLLALVAANKGVNAEQLDAIFGIT